MFVFTSRVTLLAKNETEDEFGDAADSYRAVQTGVRCHVYEKSNTIFSATDSRYITARHYEAMFPMNTVVDAGWRFKDEKTGLIYLIDRTIEPQTIAGTGYVRAMVRRVE